MYFCPFLLFSFCFGFVLPSKIGFLVSLLRLLLCFRPKLLFFCLLLLHPYLSPFICPLALLFFWFCASGQKWLLVVVLPSRFYCFLHLFSCLFYVLICLCSQNMVNVDEIRYNIKPTLGVYCLWPIYCATFGDYLFIIYCA